MVNNFMTGVERHLHMGLVTYKYTADETVITSRKKNTIAETSFDFDIAETMPGTYIYEKMLIDQKPQSIFDTKRKRKRTKINTCKINKQLHEKHIDHLPLLQVR